MTSRSIKSSLQPRLLTTCSALILAAALFIARPAIAQTPALQPRITTAIDASSRVTLTGSRSPRANSANDAGAVAPSLQLQGISLVFSRTAAQQTALDALVAAQQNPSSPLYHHWLTPSQYAAQFGVADADIATAETWLQQQGFTVNSVANSRNRIVFSGTAAQVNSAFGASLHYYNTSASGTQPAAQRFAPSSDLTLPSALASVVLSVENLSDFRPRSHLKANSAQVKPRYTVQGNQAYFLVPPDLETIYDITPAYTQGFNGAGQTIAVVGQSSVVSTDITTFQTLLGLTPKAPGLNLVPGTGTSVVSLGDESESDLDLEYSSSIAPGATVNFYYTGNSKNTNVFDALQYVVDNDLAPIITISYGDCEFDTGASNVSLLDSIVLEQAATQGETVVSSAGDDGSTDCAEDTNLTFAQQTALAVDYPASSPYVTAMGGTEFPVADVTPVNTTYWTSDPSSSTDLVNSAISYIPEQVWNDDAADLSYAEANKVSPLSSGGGGASLYEPRPSWQTGVPGIPSGTTRLVPDISLAASPNYPGYLYCTSDTSAWAPASGSTPAQTGSCINGTFSDPVGNYLDYDIAGGTSFDAPIFAGLVAIINQAKGYTTTGQGVINSTLYSLASTAATYASAFHDITSGGNQCAAGATYCGTGTQTTDFQSGVGYDEASGLGSIDFNNLLTAWPSSSGGATTTTLATATTLTAATDTPALGASDLITITVSPFTNAGTTVPTGSLSLSINGAVVNADLPLSNGTATYTFSSTTAGNEAVSATYSGDSNYASSTGTLALTVGGGGTTTTGTFTLSATNVTVAPGSSGTGTLTVTPVGGYTGTVDITLGVPPALTNFCVARSDPSVTGTTPVTSTFTVYTSASGCTAAGLTALTSSGSHEIHLSARPATVKTAIATPPQPISPWKRLPLPAALAGTLMLVCFRRRSRLLRAALSLGVVALLSIAGLGLTACGSSSTATSTPPPVTTNSPPGTYTITVTGTDSTTATITASTTFTVTIS